MSDSEDKPAIPTIVEAVEKSKVVTSKVVNDFRSTLLNLDKLVAECIRKVRAQNGKI